MRKDTRIFLSSILGVPLALMLIAGVHAVSLGTTTVVQNPARLATSTAVTVPDPAPEPAQPVTRPVSVPAQAPATIPAPVASAPIPAPVVAPAPTQDTYAQQVVKSSRRTRAS